MRSALGLAMVAALAGGCAEGVELGASTPHLLGPEGHGDDTLGSSSGDEGASEDTGGEDESGDEGVTSGNPDPSGSTGEPPSEVGCADGQREGFVDLATHPGIAACAGGWTEPGVVPMPPSTCDHQGGDDTVNPGGAGCSATDLCAEGWHVCETAVEVHARTIGGCADLAAPGFYVIAQSGPGDVLCGEGLNDLFGCGTLGAPIDSGSCTPLDRFSGPGCEDLPLTWNCGADGATEAAHVAKPTASDGGVLCCLDT